MRRLIRETLSPAARLELLDSWPYTARHAQLIPPGNWRIWANIAGRGNGKNRVESEFAHHKATVQPKEIGFLSGRTLGDVAKYIIMHPTSGLLATQHADNPCEFKRRPGMTTPSVIWASGAYADLHSSEEPDAARGGHYGWGVGDEVGSWKRVVDFTGNTTWDNLQFALRAGAHPQMVVGATPRSTEIIRYLIAQGDKPDSSVHLTRGTLDDNAANLSQNFIDYIDEKYGGTRLERQERFGELLLDTEDAILTHDDLDVSRVDEAPEMKRVVVAVDPALKVKKKSDKTGINVSGLGVADDDLYSMANRSCKLSPDGWSHRVVETCREFGTSIVVAEDNVMGDAIKTLIHGHGSFARGIRVIGKTASSSKAKRAEPILAHYERSAKRARGETVSGRGAHIVGQQKALEDQLVQFTPLLWVGEGSPDDADAHVWGGTELTQGRSATWEQMARVNAA